MNTAPKLSEAIEALRKYRNNGSVRIWDMDAALDVVLAALAPPSGEGVDRKPQRNPAFVGEWHAKAVALGYDGVADMLDSVERGEPPQHIAAVLGATPQSALVDGDALMEGWHSAVDDAGEIFTNYDTANREAIRSRASRVVTWLKAHPPTPTPQSAPVDGELARIGELIRTQDNRITDQPMFIVQQKREYVAHPDYDHDLIAWFDGDGEASEEEAAALEAQYKDTHREPAGWTRAAVGYYWDFVTACFTEQGCKDYIARDGHNLKEPRIYATGSYRNSEWRTVRNYLAGLTTPQSAHVDGDSSDLGEVRFPAKGGVWGYGA